MLLGSLVEYMMFLVLLRLREVGIKVFFIPIFHSCDTFISSVASRITYVSFFILFLCRALSLVPRCRWDMKDENESYVFTNTRFLLYRLTIFVILYVESIRCLINM